MSTKKQGSDWTMTSEFQNTIDEVRATLHVLESGLKMLGEHVTALNKKHAGWQPIATAPRDGATVDLWHKDGYRLPDYRWDERAMWWDDDGHSFPHADNEITHFMYEPNPPKEYK